MKINKTLIDYAGKILLSKIWHDAKHAVDIAELTAENNPMMTGEVKRKFATNILKDSGYILSQGLFDTVIQFAWLWLQAKHGKDIFAQRHEVDI